MGTTHVVEIPDDPLWRDDLLGQIASPFHLADGIDVVVGGRADGGLGLTFLLQNPFGVSVDVTIEIGRRSSFDTEGIEIELAPLEVLMLVVPLTVDSDTEMTVRIASDKPNEPRLRDATPGKLDLARSIVGVIGGVAGLLLLPVAHFSWSRSGGHVGNGFALEPTVKGRRVDGAAVRVERLWAPPDEPPAIVRVRRRRVGDSDVRWLRLIGLGYVMLMAGSLALLLASLMATSPSVPGLLAALIAGGVAIAVANGVMRRGWVIGHRISRITPLVGPGILDTPHPDS